MICHGFGWRFVTGEPRSCHRCLPSELCHAALPWGILSILHLSIGSWDPVHLEPGVPYSCQMVSINGFQGILWIKKTQKKPLEACKTFKMVSLWSFHRFTLRVPPGSRAPTSAPGKDCAVKCENFLKACSISYVVAFWLTKTTSYKGFLTISAQTQGALPYPSSHPTILCVDKLLFQDGETRL